MKSALFLQSAVQDPYRIYNEMLITHPVFYDDSNKLWAVYSYEFCKAVLSHPGAHIPLLNTAGLNDYAFAIIGKLPRFKNPPDHTTLRKIATALFHSRKAVCISSLTSELLLRQKGTKEINWVELVAKQLPALSILQSFSFSPADSLFIAERIGCLVNFTLPNKTEDQLKEINTVSREIYNRVEWHISYTNPINSLIDTLVADTNFSKEGIVGMCVSNLIGLLIQSYDAGRGLLSNALYHLLLNKTLYGQVFTNKSELSKFVVEILRFDPPVQHTRRRMSENILLGNKEISKEAILLVILAAANRDKKQFVSPNSLDWERKNNADHLTFGFGHHACIASDFVRQLTTESLFYLFNQHPFVTLESTDVEYETFANLRLPKKLLISLT